jgi:inner membrane protein
MKGRTHLAFGILIGLIIKEFFPQESPIIFITIIGISALIPDIDDPHSTLGKKVKPLSWFFTTFLGHRGIFHSALMLIFLPMLIWFLGFPAYGMAVFIGYLTHLTLDSLTHSGVRWLYPFKFKLKGVVKTGGIMDYILFLISIVGIIVILVSNWL